MSQLVGQVYWPGERWAWFK